MTSKRISLGYEYPDDDAISINSCCFVIGDIEITEEIEIPAWDYETPVSFMMECSVNLLEFAESCGFDSSQQLPEFEAQLVWYATKTKQKGHSDHAVLKDGTNSLKFTAMGQLLGGSLQVKLQISLSKPGTPLPHHVPPRIKGCRIWESPRYDLDLEGGASRFTVAPIDFKKAGIQPLDAMWRFEITSELLVPAQSGIRAYINTANKTSLKMLNKPNTAESKLWMSFLHADAIAQILSLSSQVAEDESIQESDFFEGSLAESVILLADALFPGEPLEDISRDTSRLLAVAQTHIFKDYTS